MQYASTVWGFVLGAVISLSAIVTVNYTVDPARIFGDGKLEHEVAEALAAGRHVIGATNLDHRLIQRYLTTQALRPPSVLVLGSSRSSEIGGNIFPDQNLLNQFVPGADLDDLKGLLSNWDARDGQIDVIVLGIDPWMFNPSRNTGVGYVKSVFANVEDATIDSIDLRTIWRKVQALISLRYVLDSVYTLRSRTRDLDGHVYTLVDDDNHDAAVLRPDGTRKSARSTLERRAEEGNIEAARVGRDTVMWGLENFTSVDAVNLASFEGLLDGLHVRNSRVIIFLPPYHPLAFRNIRERPKYRMVMKLESELRALGKERGLNVVGSYDPSLGQCTDDEFFDYHHPRPSCVERLFRLAE